MTKLNIVIVFIFIMNIKKKLIFIIFFYKFDNAEIIDINQIIRFILNNRTEHIW